MRYLEVAKYRIHRLFAGRPGTSVLQRAERATPDHSLAKLTVARGKSRVFREVKPILTHPPKPRARQVLQSLKDYRETLPAFSQHVLSFYRPVDVAFKIVGTGSVATHDYGVLHFAGDGAADPLFLQVKESAVCVCLLCEVTGNQDTSGRTSCTRTANAAGAIRHFAGMDLAGRRRLSGAATERPQSLDRRRRFKRTRPGRICNNLRGSVSEESRTFRRSRCAGWIPGHERPLRQSPRGILGELRKPDDRGL